MTYLAAALAFLLAVHKLHLLAKFLVDILGISKMKDDYENKIQLLRLEVLEERMLGLQWCNACCKEINNQSALLDKVVNHYEAL